MRKIAAFMCIVLLGSQSVRAAVHTCATVADIVTALATASSGDTIELAAGTYQPTSTLVVDTDLTIQPSSSASGAVIFDGSLLPTTYGDPILRIGDIHTVSVTINDLIFQYGVEGVELNNTISATIRDVTIDQIEDGLYSESSMQADNIDIEHCHVSSSRAFFYGDNITVNQTSFDQSGCSISSGNNIEVKSSDFGPDSSLELAVSDNVVVDGCRFLHGYFSSTDHSLFVYGGYNVEIANNEFADDSVALACTAELGDLINIHDNTFTDNDIGIYLWNDTYSSPTVNVFNNTLNDNIQGLSMYEQYENVTVDANWLSGNQTAIMALKCDNSRVSNNLLINGTLGFYSLTGGVSFIYNTIGHNLLGGIVSGKSDASSIRNNISWNSNYGITRDTSSTATIANNVAYLNAAANFKGAISAVANFAITPQFTNPGSDDYHLQSSSKCIGIARNVWINHDLDGVARDALNPAPGFGPRYGAEVGCYEYSQVHH